MLKAYMIHAGEPADGAALVFANSFREAKKLGWDSSACDGCDYIDIRGHQLKHDEWLKANAADQAKLAEGLPHVVHQVPACQGCDLWYDELFSGYCETCSEDQEGAGDEH